MDLKIGVFVRWVGSREWSSDIDTYCKVMSIDDANVELFCYDDFKTVRIPINGNSVMHEIRLAEKDNVTDFLEDLIDYKEDHKVKLVRDFNKDIKLLDRSLAKIKDNLAELNEK